MLIQYLRTKEHSGQPTLICWTGPAHSSSPLPTYTPKLRGGSGFIPDGSDWSCTQIKMAFPTSPVRQSTQALKVFLWNTGKHTSWLLPVSQLSHLPVLVKDITPCTVTHPRSSTCAVGYSTWLQNLLCHTSNVEGQREGKSEVRLPDSILYSIQEIQQLQHKSPREKSLNHNPNTTGEHEYINKLLGYFIGHESNSPIRISIPTNKIPKNF